MSWELGVIVQILWNDGTITFSLVLVKVFKYQVDDGILVPILIQGPPTSYITICSRASQKSLFLQK